MTDNEARTALEVLIRDRREDYAGLSRLIGRNAAYLQQYVRRGTPRRLAERDRATLAAYFDVPEERLGASVRPPISTLVGVPRYAVGASAGPGAVADDAPGRTAIAVPLAFLRDLGLAANARLSMIRVTGDSMLPTLVDGDDILVDLDDGVDRLRDGIYVLRVDDALLVKRLAIRPGVLAVLSDNPAYPVWNAARNALILIGRVVWSARRVR